MRRVVPLLLLLVLGVSATSALGAARFPPPDFENPHPLPTTATPPPDSRWFDFVDTGVLLATLGAAAYLVHKRRSRLGISILCLFSVAYFGFWRQGCVCSIGSVQNVALALFDHHYVLPVTVGLFFLLPIAFALFFGRVFCAAVCPMGAAQDLVLLKPLQLPRWLDHSLGLIPYVYLGLGLLFAATGTRFLFCEWDPFVPLFRLSGAVTMLALGAAFLVVGTVIGRPYCRFLCPYGAVLAMASTVSQWRVSIFPDVCVSCHLCQKSCPVNAIQLPAPRPAPKDVRVGKRRLALMLVLMPVLVAVGGYVGGRFAPTLASAHDTVKLATLVAQAERLGPEAAAQIKSDELTAFRRTSQRPQELYDRADAIRRNFVWGGWALGAWVGLVVGAKLVGLARARARVDYETDRAACVACGRCFDYCPKEYERRGDVGMPAANPPGVAMPELVPLTVQSRSSIGAGSVSDRPAPIANTASDSGADRSLTLPALKGGGQTV